MYGTMIRVTMASRNICLFGFVLLILLVVPVVEAHVPVTAEANEALETATYIHDPLKSWAIYSELRAGGVANYYRVDMDAGQRLRLSLFTPEEKLFTPGLVVMGPGIEAQGTVPAFIEVPEGAGAMVVEGKRPDQASYEPFTPASMYGLIDIDLTVNETGTYDVAVYDLATGGRYGLAIGYREEFSVEEWIRVPLDVIAIHQWEGQRLGFILAPLFGVVIGGFVILLWLRKKGALVLQGLFVGLGSFAGFLYLGSSAIMLTQMAIALSRATVTASVIVTIIFALLPLIAGVALLRVALQERDKAEPKARVTMAILGIVGLFVWAGVVIGPVVAVAASILPSGTRKSAR